MDTAKATAQATQLRESAREHKRLSNSHRRQAREDMKRLADFRAMCHEHGIEVIIEDGGEAPSEDEASLAEEQATIQGEEQARCLRE